MSKYLLNRFSILLRRLEIVVPQLFGKGNPPESLCIAGLPSRNPWESVKVPKLGLKDLIGDGMLWAVPKHRRSVEKRLNRKFGYPQWVWKPLRVKTNLLSCNQCGHDHEVGVLCPNCYSKVRTETKLMQEQIQEELGLKPIEQEVIVLYEGERRTQPSEILNGKRVIEMKKPRPMWFSKNLLQKTSQQLAETKEVKPTELG